MNVSMNDLQEVETDSLPKIEQIVEGCILTIISLGAILGNTTMWIIICRNRDLRTITNTFILSLTTADLFVAVINIPVTVLSLFHGNWPWSESVCQFFGFTNMLTLVTSVMSLCNISINRYVMVCKPVYFKRIYTKRNAALMISGCVLISMFLSSFPIFGWAEYAFIKTQMFCFCDWTKAPSYAFFMISVCFGIPFGVMTVCNAFIFRTVRASKRRVTAASSNQGSSKVDEQELNSSTPNTVTKDDVSKPHDVTIYINDRSSFHQSESNRAECQSSPNTNNNGKYLNRKNTTLTNMSKKKSRTGKSRTEEVRLAMVLAIVVLLFVISWLPYCVSMLLEIFAKDKVHSGFHMATIMLGYSNSAINPIVYGVMNKKFGDGFRRLLCCCQKF
ncbi:D(2)-like dopamine receptor [Saccostrea echinata]|uniref:D(2)-like dopamine receptor n=1 Tax=Saccostrea echinata TaxID=191078 RepID=UPI002A81EFC6|nr:D(2)-like dopamine receptor [Saccostrea echinata]